MNLGEYGNYLRVNVSLDISSRVNKIFLISPPPVVRNIEITEADGLTVGNQNIDVGSETFQANEYLEYQLKDGDIFISGEWKVRVESTASDDSDNIISDIYGSFTVNP